MRVLFIHKRSFITLFLLGLILFIFGQCSSFSEPEPVVIKNSHGEQFIGSAACKSCHQKLCDSFIHTAHFLTSRPAELKYIRGSFEPGKNQFAFDSDKIIRMEIRNKSFYQVEYDQGKEKIAQRFDIVMGSGRKGQSFITQNRNRLFQLPITYFTAAHQWSNSPGYPDRIVFNRPITARCLECHTTYAQSLSPSNTEPEKFDTPNIIYGVNCEKCHGPGMEHVQFQRKNPGIKTAKYIINPAKLSRIQNLEFCASCHGGRLKSIKPSFEFRIGDKLSDYYAMDTTRPNPDNIDVHGNQYGLLRSSKCFIKTNTLTCNTCHNSHENEAGNSLIFSTRCLNCHGNGHEQKACKLTSQLGSDLIKKDCISCHMPLKSSRAIAVYLDKNKEPTAAQIRSHYITIYPEESRRILASLKNH